MGRLFGILDLSFEISELTEASRRYRSGFSMFTVAYRFRRIYYQQDFIIDRTFAFQ